MTSEVVTVPVRASFKEVVRLLDENAVSALPVLDDKDRLVGVVSEADLLPKEEYRDGTERLRRLARLRHRRELAKATGDEAGDLMSSPAVTIDPDATLAEAARRLVDESVKRLPVVDNSGRLVGIVSRADLIESFLRPDVAIGEEVRTVIDSRVLLTEYGTVEVHVDEGVVTLTGELDRKSSVVIAERLTRSVDGVVDVKNEIEYKRDDSNSMK
ncbi:MAG TPA: CBS domain-containing protein [Jiangellaceae bacterium]